MGFSDRNLGVAISEKPSQACFPTTCWGRILQAGDPAAPEARAALEGLCRDYWYPLYAFVRRKGHDPETAQDLVQGVFADLLERNDLRRLAPERGRFRSFLMACCAHHIAKHHERERAVKRGGGRVAIPIDALTAESRFGREPSHDLTAEHLFERRWALTLLDHVLTGVYGETARSKMPALDQRLLPALLGHEGALSQHAIAAELGLTVGAVKMAALRLRARYRERLREEIARTVADPSEIDAEIRALLKTLAQ
jgi:DNA-directed RNA polymerase specialized sigma24 family protein